MMRNQSGYPDPTAERAINHVMAEQADESRPLVYICIPQYDSDELISEISKVFCRFAVDNQKTPILPLMFISTFYGDLDSPEKWQTALEMDKEMLLKCSEIWIVDGGLPTCMALGLIEEDEIHLPIRRYSACMVPDKKSGIG